jgi:hypothetical protein
MVKEVKVVFVSRELVPAKTGDIEVRSCTIGELIVEVDLSIEKLKHKSNFFIHNSFVRAHLDEKTERNRYVKRE